MQLSARTYPQQKDDIFFTFKGELWSAYQGKIPLSSSKVYPLPATVRQCPHKLPVSRVVSAYCAGYVKTPAFILEHLKKVKDLLLMEYSQDARFFFLGEQGQQRYIAVDGEVPEMRDVDRHLFVLENGMPLQTWDGLNLAGGSVSGEKIASYYANLTMAYNSVLSDIRHHGTDNVVLIIRRAAEAMASRHVAHKEVIRWWPQGNDHQSFQNACVAVLAEMIGGR